MLKFLRKYNKYILVIGGSLLMVAFLLPSALQKTGAGGGNPKVARVDGDTVRGRDIQLARQQLEVFMAAAGGLPNFIDGSGDPIFHFYLLLREAREGGFVGGRADGADELAMMPEELRSALLRQYPADAVYDSFAAVRGVMRMLGAYAGAARLSDIEARLVAAELFDFADVDAVVIRADSMTDKVPEPDEAAILAHFEKLKNTPAGAGEGGMGYLLPAAVKIEWLTVERSRIAGAATTDPIEVRKRWQSSRDQYPGEFEAERANVERDLRNELVDRLMQEIDQVVRGGARTELAKFPDAGRWKAMPPDWQSQVRSLEAISAEVADRVQERVGTKVIPPVNRRDKEWQSVAELSIAPGLSRAQIPIGAAMVPVPQILPEVREIAGDSARGPQVGVLSPPARDTLGNLIYFRVLDARKQGPPDSVDVVRDRIVRDLKRIAAYEMLASQTADIREKAIADGMQSLSRAYADGRVAQALVSRERVEVVEGFMPTSVQTEQVRSAIAETAQALDPTRSLTDIDPSKRTVVAPVPSAYAVVAAMIQGRRPVTQTVFERSFALVQRAAVERNNAGADDWPYSFQRMLDRHNVVIFDQQGKPLPRTSDAQAEAPAPASAG